MKKLFFLLLIVFGLSNCKTKTIEEKNSSPEKEATVDKMSASKLKAACYV